MAFGEQSKGSTVRQKALENKLDGSSMEYIFAYRFARAATGFFNFWLLLGTTWIWTAGDK
jgi:hypothetical protein